MPYLEPEFLPWDGRRVPMTFVAGYLGAGKTTLINEALAAADRPIAVFVNDVGEINVDARLIAKRSGDTLELTDGCVCCSLSDGFGMAFDELRSRPEPPDHLIVELSGVADPTRVLPWGRTAGFVLDGVVTVVDASTASDRLADERINETIARQLTAADLVVATRTDAPAAAAGNAAIRATVADRDPTPPIVDSTEAAAALLRLGARRSRVADIEAPSLFDPHTTTVIPMAQPLDPAGAERLLEDARRHYPEVVRAKGIFHDHDCKAWLIQLVGSRHTITPLPEAEDEPPTDLVVISLPVT